MRIEKRGSEGRKGERKMGNREGEAEGSWKRNRNGNRGNEGKWERKSKAAGGNPDRLLDNGSLVPLKYAQVITTICENRR